MWEGRLRPAILWIQWFLVDGCKIAMKKVQDYYFHKAKREGYPARSVYKLQEAQKKYRFLKAGHRVLDLGAAPGSWTKYVSRLVGSGGRVIAVDLHKLKAGGPNIEFIKTDIFSMEPADFSLRFGTFHVVLSDMAPKTSGRKDLDHFRSIELAGYAFRIASETLKPGGSFFCKVFEGEDLPIFRKELQAFFNTVRLFKPKSSRTESVEKFLFCQGKKA